MEYRRFGNSELETSVIGLGGWPMGRGQYGSINEGNIIKTVHKALDLGITLFDSAQVYGWGAGEEIMGKALRGKRHDCIIVTKGGLRWDQDSPSLKSERDSSKEFLNKMLEGSLRRLQTDYIDLFLIHWPDNESSVLGADGGAWQMERGREDTLRWCQQLQRGPNGGIPENVPHHL